MSQPIIVWFRQDLRLDDNMALAGALSAAKDTDAAILPVFIEDKNIARQPGAMATWWRNQALQVLEQNLRQRGSRLIIREGDGETQITQLAEETQAQAVFWSRQYDGPSIERDKQTKTRLRDAGIIAESFNSLVLFEPWAVKSKTGGTNFKVFSPFWRACQAQGIDDSVWDAPEPSRPANLAAQRCLAASCGPGRHG